MKFLVKEIELYTTEMGDGIPEFMLSDKEVYVLNQRCLGRWTAKDEDDLKDKIYDFIGYHPEFIDYEVKS